MKTYSPVMDEYFRIALATGLIKEATVAPHHFPGGPLEQHTKTVNPLPLAPGDVPKEDMYTRSDRSRATGYETTLNDRESRKPLDDRPGISKSNKNDTMAQIVVWFLSKEMLGVNLPTTFIDGVWGNSSREALNKLITVGKLDLAVGEKLEPSTVQKFYNDNRAKINSALASAGAEKTLAKLNIPAGKVLAADDPVAFVAPSSVVGQENVGKFTKEQMSAFMGIYNDPKFKGKDFPFIMEEATNKFPSLFPKSKYKTMDFTAANDGAMNEKMKENMWQGATLSEASMNKTSNYVVNELISLANDLDKMGEVKAAIAVDNQLSLYKTAMDKLYDITGETGEQFLNSAHPEGSVTLAPAQNEGGVVETAVDQQKKNIAIVSKDPTGKYASTIKSLIATANRLESEGNIVDAEKVDRAINELLKKSPFRHNGVAKAASTSIGKKYAAEEYTAEQIRKDLLELKKYLSAFVASIYNVKTIDDATSMSFNEFGNRLLEWSKWTDLVERKKDLLGTLLKEKVKFVDDKKITNAFGVNDQDAKSKYEAFQNIFNSIVKKIKNDPYYQFSTQGQKTDAQQSQESASSAAESSQGQKSSGQPQADGGTKKGRVYEAYLLRMKNLVGSLKRARSVINEHKDDVSKLMGIDDIKIAEELDSLDKEINTWEQKIKNNEVNLANATAANERNAKVFPVVQKLEGKFGKSASNKFAISKRAEFLTDLGSKLGPATPAKPGAGRGGAGKGGRVIFNGPEAGKLQSLIVRAGEDKYGSLLGKVDERIGPKTIAAYNLLRNDLGSMGKDLKKLPAGHQLIDEQTVRSTFDVLSDMLSKLNEADRKKLKTPSEPGTTPGAPGTTPGQPGGAAGAGGVGGKGKTTVDRRSDFLIKMERFGKELGRYQDEYYSERFNHLGGLKQAAMAKDLIERETLKTTLRDILESAVGQELDPSDITRYEYILRSYDEALAARARYNFKTDMSGVRRLYFSEDNAKRRQVIETSSTPAAAQPQEQQAPAQPAAQEQVGQEQAKKPWGKDTQKDDAVAIGKFDAIYKEIMDDTGAADIKKIISYSKARGMSTDTFARSLLALYNQISNDSQQKGDVKSVIDRIFKAMAATGKTNDK